MSRPPHVIGPPDVIPGAMRIIRPIANLNCDGARVSGISPAVVRPWTTIIGSVPGITSSVIPIASTCADDDRKEKKQERPPSQSGFHFIPVRGRFRVPDTNNIRFHNNRIRIRVSFHAPAPGSSVNFLAVLHWPRIAVTIIVTQQNPAMFIAKTTRYTTPWSSIASATFTNPAIFAPTTRLPGCPYSAAVSHAFLWIVVMIWRSR